MMRWSLTFQSNEVTSLLLGTSWPPSRMQCLKTSWVELLLLFSLRFHIRAVESPDLMEATAFDLQYLQWANKCLIFCWATANKIWDNNRSLACSTVQPWNKTLRGPFPSSPRTKKRPKVTNPDANRSLTGFQAQMKTSDSWPLRTMALFCGISTSPSTSIRSEWLSKKGTYLILLLITCKIRDNTF